MSARLRALEQLVPAGRVVADIGTDHGLLPATLVRSGRVPRAIGVDIAPGPLAAAARNRVEGVELRLGDGLAPLRPDEVHTVVLAGMGGARLVGILRRGPLDTVARVITQPTDDASVVRAFFAAWGWSPVQGRLVEERGRFYFTEAWERGARAWTPHELRCGLWSEPPFDRWLALEVGRVERALAGARRGTDAGKVAALEADLRTLRAG